MKDRIGLAFFTFAAVFSILAAWEHPSLLVWLAACHNGVLAVLYARRKPAEKYDRPGLLLGLLAAMLPSVTTNAGEMPLLLIVIGILGYGLIFWSLLTLGSRFGIAPADRGLVVSGPYRWVRHPMYLGELVLRTALVLGSSQMLLAIGLLLALAAIQIMRALREETIIIGYPAYASQVPFSIGARSMVMALHLFSLMAYVAANSYLIGWLIRQLWEINWRLQSRRLQGRMALSLNGWRQFGEGRDILFRLAGLLFGCLAAPGLVQVFSREWLLIILVLLSLFGEELRVSPKEIQLLDVIVFFDRFSAHILHHPDLFETLIKIIQELREGPVQKGVREAVLLHHSGASLENSLKAMRGIDPLLDEFILTLRLSGWQNKAALNVITRRLLVRAGRSWDSLSRILLIKEKSHTFIQFGQAGMITGLWVTLISSLSAWAIFMPDRAVIALSILVLIGLGFVFYFILTRQWLRRSLVVSIFIIALAAYANSLIVPIPAWLQIETISHQSDGRQDTGMVTSQTATDFQELPASFLSADLSEPPDSNTADPTSTPAPTMVTIVTQNPPVLALSTETPQEFDPCCLRSHQPR